MNLPVQSILSSSTITVTRNSVMVCESSGFGSNDAGEECVTSQFSLFSFRSVLSGGSSESEVLMSNAGNDDLCLSHVFLVTLNFLLSRMCIQGACRPVHGHSSKMFRIRDYASFSCALYITYIFIYCPLNRKLLKLHFLYIFKMYKFPSLTEARIALQQDSSLRRLLLTL